MPIRAFLPRVLIWAGVLLCGVVAVAGGLALRGPEVVAVGVAGVLAGCMAAGITRESPPGSRTRSTLEAAASVGAATVAVLLVVAGIAALAGGAVAALTVGAVLVVVLGARLARGRGRAAPATAGRVAAPNHPGIERPVHPLAAEPAGLLPPVTALTTAELGQEWTRTTAILAGPVGAAARAVLVARREETLDELERRDPAGFARWLANGASSDDYPVRHLRGDSTAGPGPA